MQTAIGGDRLGSGNKQKVNLKNYSRSTHDLSYLWRSSMSAGTLVPFMTEVALPGDTFEIDLDTSIKTLPTLGPLFGSYKVQLDVFECPIRLYNGKLHMNMLGIGMDMKQIDLPQMTLHADYDPATAGDNSQINPSSIYSYLNMRGIGRTDDGTKGKISRDFNAVPYLSYWDIYKNYYSNKSEERGFCIHQEDMSNEYSITSCNIVQGGVQTSILGTSATIDTNTTFKISGLLLWANQSEEWGEPKVGDLLIKINGNDVDVNDAFQLTQLSPGVPAGGNQVLYQWQSQYYEGSMPQGQVSFEVTMTDIPNTQPPGTGLPQMTEFPLENIDKMREQILQDVTNQGPFVINYTSIAPYGLGLNSLDGINNGDYFNTFCKTSQEGLGIKTYQSDLFNNWISTEWIEGDNGINAITAVDTSTGEFTVDALNIAHKIYNMLNRIAISGGSYDDWLDAVYTHERRKSIESPVYHGSLIKELGFQEVVSNADTNTHDNLQPLGTLAGRGKLTGKHKGGKVKIKCNEPSFIMGIISITPRLDYSQGNKWNTNLKTMFDLHKPALDEIGYQELITDQMHFLDTEIDAQNNVKFNSAGKQPAWINYMTNVNQCRGNFAEREKEMFMTLNRRYETDATGITDLTTYIDPSKFNHIFAQTNLDSQNFWTQIAVNMTARRKMSAKVIPNL